MVPSSLGGCDGEGIVLEAEMMILMVHQPSEVEISILESFDLFS